jgi:hypothetical protein
MNNGVNDVGWSPKQMDALVLALYLPQGSELPETGRRIIHHLVIPDLQRRLEIC